MRKGAILFVLALAAVAALATIAGEHKAAAPAKASAGPAWSFNATAIEACSCPMFCQCYFNTKPAAHGGHGGHGHGDGEHFCRFNMGFKVNKGSHGAVKLDGVKFWVAGDLGGDFSTGQMDWAVLHFDPATSKEQRDAIAAILGHLYPVQWGSFEIKEDAAIAWTADKDRAEAKLGGGQIAHVILNRYQGNTNDPIVIKNLKYWGAPRNDGFILMPNEIQAYKAGEKAFEFKGSNGFMITVDINSKDVTKG